MHFRNNQLNFNSSKEVKDELKRVVPGYKESMDIYPVISGNTNNAIECAKKLEEQRIRDNEYDNFSYTPHSFVYLVIEEIEKLKRENSMT